MPKSLRNPSPFGMEWEKLGMFRNARALIINDPGTWRRDGNHTTTISSPVSRTSETVVNQRSLFYPEAELCMALPSFIFHLPIVQCSKIHLVSLLIQEDGSMIEFRKFSEFPRGTLYDILADAYSFDERNRQIWDTNWKETDDFFTTTRRLPTNTACLPAWTGSRSVL